MQYQTKLPIADWDESEIAIEIHCDAGEILTKAGIRGQIGICGFLRMQITENEESSVPTGYSDIMGGGKSATVSTSSFAGGIQSMLYGCDVARMLKWPSVELSFGNMGGGYLHMSETIIQMQFPK